jgi:[protein-PII] uridylyltransferase
MTIVINNSSHRFNAGLIVTTQKYETRRQALLTAAQEFLADQLQRIKQLTLDGASGTEVVLELTACFDQLIDILFQAVSADLVPEAVAEVAIFALGGYGRNEMNPKSDLDLMFYYEPTGAAAAQTISDRMLYILWDLSLDVGYSVRSSTDCLEQAGQDTTVRTALLDARFLCGNPKIFASFRNKVGKSILNQNCNEFIKDKLQEKSERQAKYGSSVYLLEPNLKEGEGGLRDLHAAIWIARVKYKSASLQELVIKGVFTELQADEFREAYEYLWRIRNHLHFLGQRKSDQLTFELQEQIAAALGYRDSRKATAVEQFMQNYYTHAAHVEHLASNVIVQATQREQVPKSLFGFLTRRNLEDGFTVARGELGVQDQDIFKNDPALVMKAFELAEKHEVKLGVSVKLLIRESLPLINDKVRRSRRMTESFMNILRQNKNVGKTLRKMHHIQVLNAFIPEFKNVFCKVQFDLYHIYTVDIHTLFAIEEMCKLWEGEYAQSQPLLTSVANNIEKRELLLLAILFHDIGKGSGTDHSSKGASMIPTIARRLGLKREDSLRLQFLVQHHLQMTHLSQRRDLTDMQMISQFAELMGMSETLRMLYLLTFADLKAVGPDVWSDWKGQLLQELYENTFDILEKGNFYQEQRSEKARNRKRKIRLALLNEEYPEKRVNKAINSLSTRYLLSYRSKQIVSHLRLALGRGTKTLAMQVEHNSDGNFTELTLATIDSPGLFSMIAGVLAAHSINILGAQIHTRKTGAVLDVLQVQSGIGKVVNNVAKWQRVEADLVGVIEGRIKVEDLIKKLHKPAYLKNSRSKPKRPNKVAIDNVVSAEYTVIDIFANDKVGLLYDITRTLKELGLYIVLSKISTKVDQVADVFYVRDIFGQKIMESNKIEEIRTVLLANLT